MYTELVGRIHNEINGKFLIHPSRAMFLAKILDSYDGPHLDIGTFHGGSAILAALLGKQVVTIDLFDGFYGQDMSHLPDYVPVTQETAQENFRRFGVENLITCFKGDVSVLNGGRFSTALLDGEHMAPFVFEEWNIIEPMIDNCAIIDDTDDYYPDHRLLAITPKSGWMFMGMCTDINGRAISYLERTSISLSSSG